MDIPRLRLAAQHLLSPFAGTPAELVRRQGAVQSQDYAGAKWALGLRIPGLGDADVDRAFDAGEILRTHVLRPTWHFVAPEDIRWLLRLTGPRVKQAMAYHGRQAGLDAATIRRSNAALEKALRGGTHLTRAELADALRRSRIEAPEGQRLAHLVMEAELDGVVCSGPRRGKQFTYALLEERVPPAPERTREEAMAELATRYVAMRGPATAHDFSWWSGLTVADATAALRLTGDRVAQETVDGRTYWLDASARLPRAGRAPLAHLLPNYDEYFIGHRDRSAIGERLGSAGLVTGGSALIGNVVIVDGQLVGTWKRSPSGGAAVVDLTPAARLTAAEERAVEAAAERYAAFVARRA